MKPSVISRRDLFMAGAAGVTVGLGSFGQSGAAAQSERGGKLTMLNSTAGPDFELAVRRHVALGLQWLDLKDAIWGQTINDISLENARRVATIAAENRLGVFSLSTALCASNIAEGEAAFRKRHNATLEHVLDVAQIVKPRCIRLLSATLRPFPEGESVMAFLRRNHPWVFDAYAQMVDRINVAGYRCLIENESDLFNRVDGVLEFFEQLRRPGRVFLTWDVQNFWEAGVFPTLDVYRRLRPLIAYVHFKGGRSENGKTLAWASALEDASWPVVDIARAVVASGAVPVICLNPSHGKRPPGYDDWTVAQRDIAFLRREVRADL